MDPDIAYMLSHHVDGRFAWEVLNSIDRTAELADNFSGKYAGRMSHRLENSRDSFLKLSGRDAVGPVRASIQLSKSLEMIAFITLTDDVGSLTLKLLRLEGVERTGTEALMGDERRLYGTGGDGNTVFNRKMGEGKYCHRHPVFTESILVQLPAGPMYVGSLSRNMYLSEHLQRPLVVHFIADQKRYDLFDAILERY